MIDWLVDIAQDLFARMSGPLSFRFIMQPVVAAALAIRDGRKDAKQGRPAYFWSIFSNATDRWRLIAEGLGAVSRVIILGTILDVAYQLIVLRSLQVIEVLIIVLGLAFVPYLLIRGPANRISSMRRR